MDPVSPILIPGEEVWTGGSENDIFVSPMPNYQSIVDQKDVVDRFQFFTLIVACEFSKLFLVE